MKIMIRAFALAAVVGALSATAFAADKAPKMAGKKMMASATLKCPSCGMAMPSKKSAATPVAVKIKGHTYYCCAHCPSGQKAAKMGMKKAM